MSRNSYIHSSGRTSFSECREWNINYIYIYIFMSSCVGGSKAPPRTIITARYPLRVLYQLPMSVISETGLNRFLG